MGNKADIEYSRELDLKEKFNLFWNKALKTNGEDYLKRLTTATLDDKTVVDTDHVYIVYW
ncbi:MAG: hypothetical protein IKO23_06045 [Bacteroidales bacterium]|nr:hypothetical protein [Bacteroidales bacterium]